MKRLGCLIVLIAILGAEETTAQMNQGLSDQDLIDPWLRA